MARLLAAVCLLHAIGAAAASSLGSSLFDNGADLWQQTENDNDKSCSGCQLDKMVKNCPLDVMFLLDMSESIPPISYETARNYVAKSMQTVSDAFQDTHVGLLAFSEIVHHDIPLQQRSQYELQALTDRVRSLPQERYGTELADTLRRARRALTNHTANALVPGGTRGKVIVLVSDGCEDDDRAVEREGVQAVLDGIYIISVALSEAYLDILKKISVQILELRTDIDWQGTVACPSSFLPPVEPFEECANIVVAMDGSDSVRRWESVMRDYLAYTSMCYDNVDNAIGVVVFGTNVNEQSTDTMLPPTKDKRWLAEQIEHSLEFPHRRGTGTTAAIQVSAAFLAALEGTTAPLNAIVVITDGPALNPSSARQALANAVNQGYKVVVIGVGNVLTSTELQSLAGPTSVVLQVDSYLDLYGLDLSQYICRERQAQDCSSLPPCSVSGQVRNINNNCQCQCSDSIRCSGGQTMNINTCQCGCPNTQCPAGQTLDPVSCICGRRACNTCPNGFYQNPDNCNCECRQSCSFGQVLDPTTCVCERVCTNTCNPGFVLNPQSCICECQLTCPLGLTLNRNTCTCERVCPNTCNEGFTLNQDTCQCECRISTCPFGQRIKPGFCLCEPICTNTCNPGFQLNQQTCQCECVRTCSFGEQMNSATCTCERTGCTNTCSQGYTLNQNTCQCECTRTCQFGYQLNRASCSCECTRTCQFGYQLNRASCTCERTGCPNTCSQGYTLNQNTCQCECTRTCQNGYRLNTATCTCERFCTNECYEGYTRNDDCQCVCTRQCFVGFELNTQNCTCKRVCRNTCDFGFTLNENTCQCVCQKTCPFGQRLDVGLCQCEPVCSRTCSFPYVLNSDACQCECRRTCSSGQVVDPNTCTCGCATGCASNQDQDPLSCECRQRDLCGLTCSYPYVLDTSVEPCRCVCQRTCPAGQVLDQNSCTCGCSNTVQCGSGYRFDEQTCSCVCQRTCPFGQTLDYNSCTCGCTNTVQCGSGYRFDDQSCSCVCQRTCPFGQTLDQNSCTCGCSNILQCGSGYRFDDQSCSCVCQRTCPFGQTLDQNSCTCRCSNTLQCGSGYRFDDQSCSCVCQRTCPFGQILDQNTCSCRCSNTLQCGPGYRFDDQSCSCVCQRTCPFGQILDQNSCTCRCSNTLQCGSGYRFDDQSCSCVCDRTCPFGQVLDQNTCSCRCPNTLQCGSGYRFDDQSCSCVCQLTCPFGQTLDRNSCTCRCSNTLQCGSGYRFDDQSCSCVCQRTCPVGQTLDRNSCTCGCSNTVTCGNGFRFDQQTCGCVSDCRQTTQCNVGTIFDEVECRCVPRCSQSITCPPTTVFNAQTCQCDYTGCPIRVTCNPGFVFDETTCQCVSSCRQTQPCAAGTYFDEVACVCVSNCPLQCDDPSTVLDQVQCQCVPRCPNARCNNEQILDFNTCTCRCVTGCSADEDQDPSTCFCRPRTLCSLTCPVGAYLDNSNGNCRCVCQRTCNAGEYLDQTTCTCLPDIRPEQCTGQESPCYNNQNATRDCQGRCICNCDINKYTGKYCDIPVTSSLCDNCTFANGHYMAPVKGRCDMFVICQPANGGGYVPWVQFCAPGTIVKQEGPLLQCSGMDRAGTCPEDPCRNLPSDGQYENSHSCATYWQCRDGVTHSEGCCPQGQGFDAVQGRCVPDPNCPNNCAPGFVSCADGRTGSEPPGCPYRVNPSNRRQFFHPDAPKTFFSCSPTQFFNVTTCLCQQDLTQGCVPDYDFPFDTSSPNTSVSLRSNVPGGNGQVGYFNGNSRIILHRFGGSGFYFNYMEISLRVRLDDDVDLSVGPEMAIVSNGDCEVEESLAITIDANNVYFKVTPDGSTQIEVVAVPYNRGNGWLEIRFTYEKNPVGLYELTGTVNGQTEGTLVKGRIQDRVCALQIGHGLGDRNFKGYMDDVQIWTCKPQGTSRSASASAFQNFNSFSTGASSSQTQSVNPYRQSNSPFYQGSSTQNSGSQTRG